MRIPALALLLATAACGATTQSSAIPSSPETERTAIPGASVRSSGGLRLDATPVARLDTLWVPLDRIWRVLPAVYGLIDVPIERFDSEQNEMGNSSLKLFRKLGDRQLSKLIDCGNTQIGPNVESYEVLLTVISKLSKTRMDSNVTVVSTIVTGRARPLQFTGGYVACKSKGELEKQIATILKANLQ